MPMYNLGFDPMNVIKSLKKTVSKNNFSKFRLKVVDMENIHFA